MTGPTEQQAAINPVVMYVSTPALVIHVVCHSDVKEADRGAVDRALRQHSAVLRVTQLATDVFSVELRGEAWKRPLRVQAELEELISGIQKS